MIQARFGKHFPEFSLDVQFEARPGVTAIYGPSGAGKTLLLDCMAGFTEPSAGRILLNDEILFDAAAGVNLRPGERHCGYVFQDHALFPHMTLRQNLEFAAAKHARLERNRRVSEMLERFRLAPFDARFPREVSGGQKQRCSIARALITEPRMLLLDEPARGLDVLLRGDLYELVREIRSQYRIPILLVSHDVAECLALADTMLVLSGGRILQSDAPRAVYDTPAAEAVARMLGRANLFEGEILALDPGRNTSRIRMLGAEFAAVYFPGRLLGDRVRVTIAETEVKLRDKPGQNRVAATLKRVVETPHTMRLEFESGITAEVTREAYRAANGRPWVLEFPAEALAAIG